jgi:DNA-binding transcriptional regulator YiaG
MSTTTSTTQTTAPVDIGALRREQGLTAIELALRAGVSLTTLRQFEAGWRPGKSAALERVRAALGLD